MQRKRNAFEFIRGAPALNLIAGGMFIVIAILLSDIPRMIVSPGWPTTGGTILYHKFMGVKFKEYDGGFFTKIDVYIRYEYAVEGVSYTSLSINAIDTPANPSSYADRFPVGEDVTVYYNPKDPADAVLEPGFVNIFKAFGGFSFLILVVGVSLLFLGILENRKMRDRNLQQKLMEKYLNE
ncbi:MAG: DUF3592 domain-containing protein [Ardenticatenaceae bacterium]|nr:DUF3592 domain-containing protein [Ardenticatenaceae bacterium]